jgi:hypothetical protein
MPQSSIIHFGDVFKIMTERYLPVPVWNNTRGTWEPLDYRHGQLLTRWPTGFDPARLLEPEYRDGDRVQFVRDETCAREGVVRIVRLRGGTYNLYDAVEQIIKEWYCNPNSITYLVTARGHDHVIKGWNILGRFVSPTWHA